MPDAIPPGNPDAIGSVLEAYRDRLRRMVQLRIDPRLRTRIDPSDVVQEVFLEASVRFSEVRQDAPGGVFAWLRLLTTQKLAQLWRHHLETQGRDVRREEAWPALGGVDTTAGARDITAAGPMPDSEAGRAELIDRTVRVLEQLPPLDREVLALSTRPDATTRRSSDLPRGVAGQTSSPVGLDALGRARPPGPGTSRSIPLAAPQASSSSRRSARRSATTTAAGTSPPWTLRPATTCSS